MRILFVNDLKFIYLPMNSYHVKSLRNNATDYLLIINGNLPLTENVIAGGDC